MDRIEERARQLGFGQIAFLPVQSFPLWEQGIKIRKKIDPETADYWEKRGLSHQCLSIMEDAKTIIAATWPYLPYKYPFSPDKGYYSAHYSAYPRGREAVSELSKLLTDQGCKVLIDPPLPVKEIAYRSGLGKFGKNSLIHNEQSGSLMTLHLILTNAQLPASVTAPGEISDCGSCRLCIDACPMNAIDENGALRLSRCIRYHMLSSDIIPLEVREEIGDRILGCEDCQISCPRNRAVYNNAVKAEREQEVFDIRKLLSDHAAGLKKHMKPIGELLGKNYARPQRILSMAVIAAGNSGDQSYIPLLAAALYHPHPPIRAHSAWAIGKLGGQNAVEALQKAIKNEKDSRVLEELNMALKRVEFDKNRE